MSDVLTSPIIGTTFDVCTREILSYSDKVIKEGDIKNECEEYCKQHNLRKIWKVDVAAIIGEYCFLIQCKYGFTKIPTESVTEYIEDCKNLINYLYGKKINYKFVLIYLTRTAPAEGGITALLNYKNIIPTAICGLYISLYDKKNELNGYTIADNIKDFYHLWAILYYRIYEITGVYPTFKELGSNDTMMLDVSLFK